MGGYFLSDDKNAKEKAIEIFAKKGLGNYSILNAGECELVYFYKQNADISDIKNDFYQNGNDFVVGSGVFIYEDMIGTKALEKIYLDFGNPANKDIFKKIKGHFNFVIYKNNQLYVVTDKTGNYHSYQGKNKNHFYISTSFLSVCENLEKLTVQKQELLEYINTSVWQGKKSIFKEVNKLESGNLIHIDKKLNYYPYYKLTFKGESVPLNKIVEHIKNYFSFLKNNDIDVLSDLTGGADSRLLLAILHSQASKYKCYTLNASNDLKLAKNIAESENISLEIFNKKVDEKYSDETYYSNWEKIFYFFDMTRPMFIGASLGELESVEFTSRRKNLMRFSGHAAELTRNYDWIYEKPPLYDFIQGPQVQMIMSESEKKKFIKNIINKLREEVVFDNEKKLSYKDINKIYFLLRCRGWAGARMTASNQLNYHLFPFEDLSLSDIFFNQDEEVIRHNLLIKQLLKEFYPGIGKYPSSYSYSFEDMNDKAELKYIGKPIKSFKDFIKVKLKQAEAFAWGGAKRALRYRALIKENPDIEPFIISKELTEKIFGKRKFIIKSILKDLNITVQNEFIKDGIFSAEYLLRKYENKLKY